MSVGVKIWVKRYFWCGLNALEGFDFEHVEPVEHHHGFDEVSF